MIELHANTYIYACAAGEGRTPPGMRWFTLLFREQPGCWQAALFWCRPEPQTGGWRYDWDVRTLPATLEPASVWQELMRLAQEDGTVTQCLIQQTCQAALPALTEIAAQAYLRLSIGGTA